jgi:hypothetical protein|tara:strand:+ start:3444 stop:3767 length:324 start_codon:yes stop_codon:yes gene_type:complete
MAQTKRKGGSKKRLPAFKALTSTLNPRAKTFSPKKGKKRLPVFKLLTSGLSPATRVLLRKPKSSKRPLNILEVASRLRLNANAKTFSPKKKGKGTRKKRKGRKGKKH